VDPQNLLWDSKGVNISMQGQSLAVALQLIKVFRFAILAFMVGVSTCHSGIQ